MKNQSGFMLVVAVGFLMLMMSAVWLVQVGVAQQERERALSHLQQEIHQARIQLFWQALAKDKEETWVSWQLHADRSDWIGKLQQRGLSARVEVQPLRLVIALPSELVAHTMSARLTKSEALGHELYLTVPEEGPKHEDTNSIQRVAKTSQIMETDVLASSSSILNIENTAGVNVDLDVLHANQVNTNTHESSELNAINIEGVRHFYADNSNSFRVESENVIGSFGLLEQVSSNRLMADEASVKHLKSIMLVSGQSNVETVSAVETTVLGSLPLSENQLPEVKAFHLELNTLEEAVYNCLYISEWCLAPVKPKLLSFDCYQCQSEQFGTSFLAVLRYYVSDCRHGCGIRLQVPETVFVNCPVSRVQAGQAGWLRCELSGVLDHVDEISFVANAQLYSLKNTSVYTEHHAPIEWQLEAVACNAMDVLVDIQERWPPATFTLTFPSTPGGESYAWFGNFEYSCNNTNTKQLMFCDMAADCTRYGTWQNAQASCICRDW